MGIKLKTKCAYCGKYRNTTKDHVPPQSMFGSPKPSNLITVPACKKCHKETTKDDEYFKTALTLNARTKNHPDVKKILPSVQRALVNPNKFAFRKALLKSSFYADVQTKGGVYLGKRIAFRPDLERLNKVIQRIVRGLYYNIEKTPMGNNIDIRVTILDDTDESSMLYDNEFKSTILSPLMKEKENIVGQNTFIYWYKILDEEFHASAWILAFFNSIGFCALALPEGTD
ncbi:MAG: HNH endonuclease [Thermoplasmatales archaeon]|nr:HNH endonuclease [Thermoplasmatales archaeon]